MQLRLAFALGMSSITWSHVFGSGSSSKFPFFEQIGEIPAPFRDHFFERFGFLPFACLGGEVIRMMSAYEDGLCKVYHKDGVSFL